ncbi:MAG: GNAT family N-acetyltransferase [Pseudonocardiaceae bacterium]
MTDPIRPLRGEHVYLRPLEPADAELIHRWYSDARVLSLMGDLPRSLAHRQRAVEASIESQGDDHFSFVICRLTDSEPVGRTDVFEIDRHNGSAAFGITIGDPSLWGHGLGTDAINAIVDFAFGQLRLERLWLGTDARNTRAHAAYAKAGFTVEGRLRRAYFQDGEFVDEIRMAMLRDEWAALTRPRSWDLVERAVQAR